MYSIYGISTGDDATFYNCGVGSGGITLDHAYLTLCRLKGAITLIANSDPIIFQDCIDATGAAADFELIFVANATAILRNLRGAVTLKSMAATNSVVIDGALRVTIDGSCTAGSITVRGFAPALTGAAAFVAAGGTITQDARYSVDAGVTLSAAAVDAILDDVIEGSLTMRQALRIFVAALAGKSSGGGTATIKFRNIADDGDRITATVDANGNRTAITISGA